MHFPLHWNGVKSRSCFIFWKNEAHWEKIFPKLADREQILVAAYPAKSSINLSDTSSWNNSAWPLSTFLLWHFLVQHQILCVPVIRRPQLSLQAACFPFFPYLPANVIIIPVVWNSCSRGSVLDLSFRGCLRFELGLLHGCTIWIGPFKKAHLQGNIWKENQTQIDPTRKKDHSNISSI